MDLFIYSDESGVFDKEHNEIYVYGGLIFLGKEQKDSYKFVAKTHRLACGMKAAFLLIDNYIEYIYIIYV